MRQGKEQRNKVTTRNEEVGQINTQVEEELAGTSTVSAIRKSSHATFILSTDRRTRSREA
jgi:hypothetical protein